MDRYKKLLALEKPFLKPGFGFSSHPENFIEDLFFETLLFGERNLVIKIEREFEPKPFFWIEAEKETDTEETLTLSEIEQTLKEKLENLNEIIKPVVLKEVIQNLLKNGFAVKFNWNEEVFLLSDLLYNPGTYHLKTNQEGSFLKLLG